MSEADSTAHIQFSPIPGFPAYCAGDNGTIWSCFARNSKGQGRMEWKHDANWRRISTHRDSRGRERCELRDAEGAPRKAFVHRLVLLAFVGECPIGMECCHNDGDSTNNDLRNLRWDTHKSNINDKVSHGTLLQGEQVPWSKLTDSKVLLIRASHESGEPLASIASRFDVTPENISQIVSRKTWRHI